MSTASVETTGADSKAQQAANDAVGSLPFLFTMLFGWLPVPKLADLTFFERRSQGHPLSKAARPRLLRLGGFLIEGSSDVRKASSIAMCALLLAMSGCSRGKIEINPESDNFKDGQFNSSMRGMSATKSFQDFLQGCSVPDRVKYINKSAEQPPTKTYPLKVVYEHFVNDPSPEVAAAAKDAIERCPTLKEYQEAQNAPAQ